MLLFAAATQGWFLARNQVHETIILLLVAFTLFRPGFWMDMIVPPFENVPPSQLAQAMGDAEAGQDLRLTINGVNAVGDPITFTALLPVPEGETGEERVAAVGLDLIESDGKVIIDNAAFGSPAQDAGLDWDQEIVEVFAPAEQPTKYWMYLPALAVLALVIFLQRGRARRVAATA